MASGVVWVVATLVGVVLGFADAASLPLDDPTLWSQFTDYVWTLETLRVAIISALVAAVATTVAAMSLQRKGIATAAFLAVGALLPLALAGHASGTTDHETAVNTIAAHLVGGVAVGRGPAGRSSCSGRLSVDTCRSSSGGTRRWRCGASSPSRCPASSAR